jgi:hypothetical protein
MGIINEAQQAGVMDLPSEAQNWAASASSDKRSAEGMQDAARHAEWTASTSALIEQATKKGLMTDQVRKMLGENPAAALEYLARGLGNLGGLGAGTAVELIGGGMAAWDAGKAVLKGDFGRAGGIISNAYDSAKMDMHNNVAGALNYSQIKDPAERRAAILRASEQATLQDRGVTVSPSDAAGGGLVRRR